MSLNTATISQISPAHTVADIAQAPASKPQDLVRRRTRSTATPCRPRLGTHALHYGSGVFEGIRAYATRGGTAVFRLPEHLERMRKGCRAAGHGIRSRAGDRSRAGHVAREPVSRCLHPPAGLVSAKAASGWTCAGHAHAPDGRHLRHQRAPQRQPHARVGVSHVAAQPGQLAAAAEAVRRLRQFDPGQARGQRCAVSTKRMFVDDDGNAVECTGANLFFIRDGAITAVEHRDALPGITRDTLVRITGASSRPVSMEELLDADEVFACGTAAEVAPIARNRWSLLRCRQPAVARNGSCFMQRTVRGQSSWSRPLADPGLMDVPT